MKARDAYYDNLRFFLILLVVIGHFAVEVLNASKGMEAVFLWIYSFHMPLFLFVGGLFSKKSIEGRLNVRRVFGFLTIYLVYKVARHFLRMALGTVGRFSLFREAGLPWYMLAMAAFYVITYLVKKCNPWIVLGASMGLACAAGYLSFVGDVLCISRIIVYYPFFFAGYCVNREKFSEFTGKKPVRIAGLCILICLAAVCIFAREQVYPLRPLLTGHNPFNKLPYAPQLGALWRLLYYGVAAGLGIAFAAVVSHRNLGIVTAAGARTLQIYVLHRLILYVLVEIAEAVGMMHGGISFTELTLWMAMSVALTFLLSAKCLEKPFLFLMDPMKYWKKRTV